MAAGSIETGGLSEQKRTNTPKAIGERLRALMTVSALTTKAVAHLTGTSEGHVVGWLEGRYAPPRGRMNRLTRQVGVKLAWVYEQDHGF